MKRVLIITYYWPPSGGSGVQRWLKMSKYLPEYGWQPVIYTALDAEYPVEDRTLERDIPAEAEIIKRKIVEPYTFYKRFLGIKNEQKIKVGFINEGERKQGWKENLSLWIRGNLFIPDARCWWIKPSVRYLKKYLKEHPVNAIISTGPPHSMHLIALKLHKALNIPWIADFRDPWTEIDYYDQLHLTPRSDRKHHKLEHEVLTQADQVVTVAPDGARRLEALGACNVKTIYNGFDWNDEDRSTETRPQNEKFNLTYIGVLSKIQNPENLWEAIGELVEESESFGKKLQINMIGQIDQSVEAAIRKAKLEQYVVFRPYIPHKQVLQQQQAADLLLLLLMPDSTPRAKGLLTGKLFEYLSSGTPILCIGPEDGDAAHIISEVQAGVTVDFEDKGKMKTEIYKLFTVYKENQLKTNRDQQLLKYSRRNLAKDFVKILNDLQ